MTALRVLCLVMSAARKVVWFSVAREISRRATTVVPRYETATDDDGGPPPPERFSPRDVLLIIDPERMESASVRIGG